MENNSAENIGGRELSHALELSIQSLRSHIAIDRKEGRLVNRFPEQLRPHRALDGIRWTPIVEPREVARRKSPIPEPILITNNGTILAGDLTAQTARFTIPVQASSVVLNGGPTWTSGLGAPSNPCSPPGSLYSQTDGSPGKTLFVCEVSAWVSK